MTGEGVPKVDEGPPQPEQGPPQAPPPLVWGTPESAATPSPARWAPTAATGRDIPEAPGFVFAGVAGRIVAWIVDLFVIFTVFLVLYLIAYFFLPGWTGSPEQGVRVSQAILLFVEAVYLVPLWRGRRRATFGMRLTEIQVGNAFDGRQLTTGQAIRRWAALAGPTLLAPIVPITSGLLIPWWIVLWISIVASPTRQGLHDRFAHSAVAGPAREGPASP